MEALKQMQEKVLDAKKIYEEIRKKVRIPQNKPYQRLGIESLSEPFVQGVFTLAVIGPMSAGKSSFINALLEDEDLLPTGHFQTTCTLTELIYSPQKNLKVEYGDGHIDNYEGDNILKTIKEVVAIPVEYKDIPINHVNQLILDGKSLDEIWQYKSDLELIAGGVQLDRTLLEKYYQSRNASNIPVHVWVEYPLSESYKGWRIVDTPGIGAIGGIDEKTKDFIANENVDAAIFLFNGKKEIDNNEILNAVSISYSQLSDVAKERTFFVITRGGDPDCQSFIEKTMERALKLFSTGAVRIPRERFFVVDNMLSLLYDCAIKTSNLDPSIFLSNIKENFQRWGIDEITDPDEKAEETARVRDYRTMISHMKDSMEYDDIEVNTENLNNEILKVAGFVSLKKELGDFAVNAKKEAYERIRCKIIEDFNSFSSKKKEDKTLLELKITRSPEDFEVEINKKIEETNAFKIALKKKYNEIITSYSTTKLPIRFEDTVKACVSDIGNAKYDYQFDNVCNNFNALIKKDQEIIIRSFVSDCERLTRKDVSAQFRGMVIPSIDVEGAEARAKAKATHTVSHQISVKKKGFINGLKNFFGIGDRGLTTETITTEEVNSSEKLSEKRADIEAQMKEVINSLSKYIYNSYVQPTGIDIQSQLQDLIAEKNKEYIALQNRQSSENEIRKDILQIEEELLILETAETNLNEKMML